ncbi:Lrp/AsnC family transcriptional regulator [Nocardioides sp.]|uniref:Lrp/AsnC family transcriptional regulator n=1 Tax=Nocardioides sp. TaxID=35761 RepID=UPI0019ACD964|nr:Lrp/AsnC family transcriptional regulator [Nocardioides sp.]MBC7277637.1 Lrp/AsnC family transcriptional regulator [Nocardioides sp.]
MSQLAKIQPPAAALDSVDRGILRELGDNPELTNKALATRLGIAESTCAYRLRALRDNGVITGRRLDVDTRTLGYPLQAVIKVRLGSHSKEHVEKLYDDLVRTPGVIQAFHVAGADDFHLYVAVEDAEALRDFVLQHVTVHRVVRQTETLLVFELREGPGVLPRDPA